MARPRKQTQEGEKDDQPTYVVEDSQDVLSNAEYEALLAADNAETQKEENVLSSATVHNGAEEAQLQKDGVTSESALMKQQVASIGASCKRRLAKVVGDEGEDEAAPERSESGNNGKRIKVKKGKKMKLSFDEELTEV